MTVAITPVFNFGMPDYTYYGGDTLKDYLRSIQTFLVHSYSWVEEDAAKAAGLAKHLVQIEKELKRVLSGESQTEPSQVWLKKILRDSWHHICTITDSKRRP